MDSAMFFRPFLPSLGKGSGEAMFPYLLPKCFLICYGNSYLVVLVLKLLILSRNLKET